MTELEQGLSHLRHGDYVGLIYESSTKQLDATAQFLRDGLARHEQCICITGDTAVEEIVQRLETTGVDAERERENGRLRMLTSREPYLRSGRFDPRKLIGILAGAQDAALAEGYSGLRFLGEMTWLFEAGVEDEEGMAYEARLEGLLKGSRTVALCQYDRARLDPALLHDLLLAHPMVVIDDLLCTNPYYEPSGLLLSPEPAATVELKRKRANWRITQLTAAAAAEREKKKLEEQLRQTQKMEAISRLAGGIAHDFNNVLTVVRGYGQILLGKPGLSSDQQEMLRQVAIATDQGMLMTKQLLAVSRKQMLVPKMLNVNEVIQAIEPMLRHLIGEGVTLTTTLEPDLGNVTIDPEQIEQVLLNIVVNACDAMPNGGTLIIETKNIGPEDKGATLHTDISPEACVMLAITDSGVGMTDEIRENIFEPFFTTKERKKGTGLGLAMVHGVIKQSGGEIEVRSAPGEGTAMTIYLPRTA